MKKYELMHKNYVVMQFELDVATKEINDIRVVKEQHVPLSVKTRRELEQWLINRSVPAQRLDIREMQADVFALLIENHALSLSDHYWMREFGTDLSWESINFYDNHFESSIVLDYKDYVDTFTPNTSLIGDLEKRWIIGSDGSRTLLKGCSYELQSVSEVLASKIYESLGVLDYVEYHFADALVHDRKVLGCACNNFTTDLLEFVPAIDIVNMVKRNNQQSYYQLFCEICKEHGLADIENKTGIMFAIDFLIANTDRHLNNFGILRDSESLEWKQLAPVFDSGNALFYSFGRDATLPKSTGLLDTSIHSFYSTFYKQMKCVRAADIDFDQLPAESDMIHILKTAKSLTKKDIEQRLELLLRTGSILRKIKRGEGIWEIYQSFEKQKD